MNAAALDSLDGLEYSPDGWLCIQTTKTMSKRADGTLQASWTQPSMVSLRHDDSAAATVYLQHLGNGSPCRSVLTTYEPAILIIPRAVTNDSADQGCADSMSVK